MTIAGASLAAAFYLGQIRSDGRDPSELQEGRTANAVDVLLQCQCFVEMDSEVFNRRFERNTVSINVCTLTFDRFKTRCRPYRHNLSLICVQLNIVAIHPDQNTFNIYLNTGLKRNELIGWCTFGQLSVIDVRVTITVMEDRNHI